MKTLGLLLVGFVALSVAIPSAMARPDYKKAWEAKYAVDDDACGAPILAELKCNVCHYGKTKKNRNDYGVALSKICNKETYTELKSDKEKLIGEVKKALVKIEAEKSVAGETFGKLIKAGKAPGTVPEEEKKEE